ncbi:DUF4236 domain-containing protein [Streptomyces sp. URMC 123]|uniref:DUF4236 domain-containing protein n=1 Tax=Streptomyces sp. URMC 123 TaxID=3423403 RepID=UPI003F1C17F0
MTSEEAVMPVHYHQRVTLIPKLVHLHLGSHGWSVTIGPRRAHITLHKHGRRTASVRLPGGLVWRRSSRRR